MKLLQIQELGLVALHQRAARQACTLTIQGVSKKTSFCQNWQWQILLLIMRNPLLLFMSNAGDSFRNSYIYYLVGLHLSDKFLVPLLLWNSIARKDRWGWLNCGLGGIFVLESLSWAKEYNIELEKQQNNLGKIHHMCSHIYLLWEKGLVFYLYLQESHIYFSLSTVIFVTGTPLTDKIL